MKTYGDPENYTVLGCILEERCDCCGSWDEVGSLWGIDFYDPTDNNLVATDEPYELDASGLWDGVYGVLESYAKEVADQLLADRRYQLEHV